MAFSYLMKTADFLVFTLIYRRNFSIDYVSCITIKVKNQFFFDFYGKVQKKSRYN
jgi:hypothetical protein